MSACHVDLAGIQGAMEFDGAMSRPQWQLIWEWVEANIEESDRHDAYVSIARQWLSRLSREVAGDCMVYESPVLFLMTTMPEPAAIAWIRHAERVLAHIQRTLPRIVSSEGYGKRVALLMPDQDRYYTYVAHYYQDGSYATSGGCCIHEGYCHVVVNASAEWSIAHTLTHELAHVSMMSLTLPLWLEEGLVQIIERAMHPEVASGMTRELRQRHRDHWAKARLKAFWSGDAFHEPESQELSYSLAYVLASNLLGTRRADFQQFLLDAGWEDHGEAAVKRHYGISLADCVCAFMGDGPWAAQS